MFFWVGFGWLTLDSQTFALYFVITFAILEELSENGLNLSLGFFCLCLVALEIKFDIAFL